MFEWIERGLKTVELRKGRPKAGEEAVFQCGGDIIRARITEKREGSLQSILETIPYSEIIPTTRSAEEAEACVRGLYRTTDGIFTAYCFRPCVR